MRLVQITLATLVLCCSIAVATAGESRGFANGRFALDIGGTYSILHSFSGGAVGATVIHEAFADGLAKKHLGLPLFSPIDLEVGLTPTGPLDALVGDLLANKAGSHSGAVVLADFNYREKRRIEFTEATLAAITFPACDAAAKDIGYLGLSLVPEVVRWRNGGGGQVDIPGTSKKSRPWVRGNFRLTIPKVDCTKVSKIDSLTIKQTVLSVGPVGLHPVGVALSFSNLVVTVPESAIDSWMAWYESFVMQGKNSDGDEKIGTLVLLAPDLQTELCVLTLRGLGIVRIAPDGGVPGGEAVRRAVVTMYCEGIGATFSGK